MTRVAIVYPNARRSSAQEVERWNAPDSPLLGENHMEAFAIDARIHDPLLTRVKLPARLARVAWSIRELPLPWEIGRADAVVTGLANLFPLVARLRPGLSVILVNYGLNQVFRRSSTARRRLMRTSLRSAAAIVCFGESQRRELVEWGIADRSVSSIPFGIDETWFSADAAWPASDPVVLAVGKDLARDFATFTAAVDGLPVRSEIIAMPRNLEGVKLPPNVTARQVGIVELRNLYSDAGCVVIPQHPDTFGYGADGGLTVLLEAMAMSRPIVATDRALIRDYVDDGVEALLVPAEEPNALRAAVERILGDGELAHRLGRAARARVERDYTTRSSASGLATLIKAVV
jgi:glycosyltransferase involved in cell wall biosynthesis